MNLVVMRPLGVGALLPEVQLHSLHEPHETALWASPPPLGKLKLREACCLSNDHTHPGPGHPEQPHPKTSGQDTGDEGAKWVTRERFGSFWPEIQAAM